MFMLKEYFPVVLKTILINTKLTFNIYNKIKGEYVLYETTGKVFTKERIENLKNNKVGVIYISSKECDSYIQYLIDTLSCIVNNKNIPLEEQLAMVHYSIRCIADIFFTSLDLHYLDYFKNLVKMVSDFIIHDKNALEILIKLAPKTSDIPNHSVNVGIIGTGLAKSVLNNDNNHDLFNISLGFFLHDIGKCKISRDIQTKDVPLTHNEWRIIKQHPLEGYKYLNNIHLINEAIKIIVMQHHERKSGRGYPMGLKGDEIHQYAEICSVIDSFDAITSKRPYRKTVENTFNALLIIKREMIHEIDPLIFKRFIELFHK